MQKQKKLSKPNMYEPKLLDTNLILNVISLVIITVKSCIELKLRNDNMICLYGL